jgi:hypothetical protein
MDPLAIVPSRPWYRRPSLYIGVVVVLAIAAIVTLIVL